MGIEFKKYREQIRWARNHDEAIDAIANLVRKMELGHFFKNGNGRTNTVLILNRLLIENNYPPVILKNPGVSASIVTLKEIRNAIFEGMQYYLQLVHQSPQDSLECANDRPIHGIDSYGRTAAHWAAGSGALAPLKDWLKKYPEWIHQRDVDGLLPIHWAIELGRETIIQWLSSKGGDPYLEQDSAGNTLAHFAVIKNAHQLLFAISDLAPSLLGAINTNGETPVLVALRLHHYSTVNFLADHALQSFKTKDKEGVSALSLMQSRSNVKKIEPQHIGLFYNSLKDRLKELD
jgi:ankyrin repeat protein